MALIPFKVRALGSSRQIITYAKLDNFSCDCFIANEVLEDLGISGPKTLISLMTIECQGKSVATKAISGLEVMDLDENEKIHVPVTFAKETLPISKEDLMNKDECHHYRHLADIPFVYVHAKVGLMLGANLPEALKPLEIVSENECEPYASKHKLGWAVYGPFGKISRNHVKVSHNQVEHCKIEKELRRLYSTDFTDSAKDDLDPSVEDKIWLNKVESSMD